MIKRVLAIAVAAILLLFGAGCVGVNFSVNGAETVFGKGPMTTVEYEVGEYTSVDIENEMELYYTAEQSDKVVIELQENLAEYLDVSVKDGVLIVKSDKRFKSEMNKTARLHISVPKLDGLRVRGALTIKQSDTIKSDSFTLDISGAADGGLNFEVDTLNVEVSGACSLMLSGTAREAGISASGASSVNALGMQTEDASVSISGVGDISVACSETLDIDISGTGSVSYKGDPRVNQKTSGAVSIKRLD